MRDVRSPGTVASYQEFVTARGPALFRSAYLLAGSSAGAEALLQHALVRLFPAWRRARHAPSVDGFATHVLLATFLSGRHPRHLLADRLVSVPPDREPDPDPTHGMVTWPHLAALTRRQRAVVVLGYADALGDHQIAELLAISPRAVAVAGGAALTRLASATGLSPDDLRDRLDAELREVAETRPLPDVAADGLGRLGAAERVRRRKGLLAVSGLAAVLALAAAFLPRLPSGGPIDRPVTAPRHPQALAQVTAGPDTSLPWWSGGELHLGDRVLPTGHDQVVAAGGTTLVGDIYVSGFDHLSTWWCVTRDGLVRLVTSTTTLIEPAVSPDGTLVAWPQPLGPHRRLLVLWSVPREHAVDGLPLRVHSAGGGEVVVRGVDSRGQVFFDTGGPLRVWRPGQPSKVVRGISGGLDEVHAYHDGITWQARANDSPGPFPTSYGRVDQRGRIHDSGTLPNGSLWSPDGEAYAFVGDYHRSGVVRAAPDQVWVADALHSHVRRMRLPTRVSYQLVAWESPQSVVVAVRRDTGKPLRGSDLPTQVQLLRCDVGTGACDTAGLAPLTILGLSPPY